MESSSKAQCMNQTGINDSDYQPIAKAKSDGLSPLLSLQSMLHKRAVPVHSGWITKVEDEAP